MVVWRPVPLAALSTQNKLGLGLAALVFIVFALASAMLIPRYRPDFPGEGGLRAFLAMTVVLFVGMVAAVERFGADEEEPAEAAAEHRETTPNTAPATTSAGGAQTLRVTEIDYEIRLGTRTLNEGTYTFLVKNAGRDVHNLAVKGPGISNAISPTVTGGKTTKLTVGFQERGEYELYCAVPGHEELGMTLKIQIR